MQRFYFNECLPESTDLINFSSLFCATIKEFNLLVIKHPSIEKAIITEKLPSKMFISNLCSLYEIIEQIHDRDVKTLAFSFFNKYPIDNYFNISPEVVDDVLESGYTVLVDGDDRDATNLAIVGINNQFLFTVGLNENIRCHVLNLTAKIQHKKVSIYNLFGDSTNTEFISKVVADLEILKLSLFNQLIALLNAKYSKQFKKDFDDISAISKELIISHFKIAIDRKLQTSLCPDGELIKDVTPARPKCGVYELRVFKERALRVYFIESETGVFLSNIGFKNNNQQDNDIKQAHLILNKLILTS